MTLSSERLLLKELTWDDLKAIYQLHTEPEVEEFNTIGIPKHIEETSEIVCAAIEDQAAATRKHYAYAILEDDVRK